MSVGSALRQLEGRKGLQVDAEERMSRHTTFGVGGPAALLVTCDTYDALRFCVETLAANQVPWVIMGRGSGVVVSDEGYIGAVITLGRDFRRVSVDEKTAVVLAGAGLTLQRLIQETLVSGLSGLEGLAGIPGTVGGAVSTNVAAGESNVGLCVESVVAMRPGTGLVRYDGADLNWYVRMSDIPPREVILEVSFALQRLSQAQVRSRTEAALARNGAALPLRARACDGLFADVTDASGERVSVGRVLADCGLAGATRGRIQASSKDPNYLVNLGGGTARDAMSLIVKMMSEVRRRYGYELRPQAKFLGFPS